MRDGKRLTVGSLIVPVEPARTAQVPREQYVPAGASQRMEEAVQIAQDHNVHKIHAQPYQTLLEAALGQGKEVRFKCRKGSCGMCQVQVLQGQSALHKPSKQEIKKLGPACQSGGARLACQAVFR